MNKSFWLWQRAGRLWVQGLLLFLLRMAQNKLGFDPETGLSVPSLPGKLLPILLGVCAIMELALCFRLPKERQSFAEAFSAPDRTMPVMVGGSLLLAAGGALMVFSALPQRGIASTVAGALAVAAGGGLLLLVQKMRKGGDLNTFPVLPLLFFSVFLVLAVYLPADSDPVLARFYIPVLAAAMAAYAFSQLAGFLRQESSPRVYVCVNHLAVLLCITALADALGNPGLLVVFAACALLMSLFLLLWREGEPAKS